VVELALEMLHAATRPKSPPAHRRHRHRVRRDPAGAVVRASDACGVGTDISEAALRTASSNAANLRLADRAGFVACDYAAALSDRFDLIVSNPPYIRSAEIAGLAAEVRDTIRAPRWMAAPTVFRPIAP